MPLAQEIIHRVAVLENNRSQWENLFEDIRDYIYPITASFTSANPGDRAIDRNRKIFDPTAERAHSDLVGALMGGLTNSSIEWFQYSTLDPAMMDKLTNRRPLERATKLVHSIFKNPESAFYSALHEWYFEITGLGTAHLFKRGKGTKSTFETIPLAEMLFEENHLGQIDTAYHCTYMTPKQLMDQFPEMDEDLMRNLENAGKDPNVTNKYKMIHCIKPRKNRDKTKIDAKNKAYMSVYILEGFGQHVLEESGFDRFPVYSARWEKIAGREVYGRSPAMKSLKDAKVLNQMVKTNLEAGEQIVMPALQGPYNAYVGKIKLMPRFINFYKMTMGISDPTLKPINVVGNLPVGLEMEQQRRQAIKESFFIDLLQEDKRARMTQLESAQSTQDRLMKMAPQTLRIQTEALTRLVTDLFDEIKEEGLLDDLPEEIQDVQIVYNSPLVQAQKQSQVSDITGFANLLAQFAQVFPDLLLVPKPLPFAQKIATVFGIDAKDLNSEEEINAEKERQREVAANEAAAKQTRDLAAAGKDLAAIQSQGVDPASLFA